MNMLWKSARADPTSCSPADEERALGGRTPRNKKEEEDKHEPSKKSTRKTRDGKKTKGKKRSRSKSKRSSVGKKASKDAKKKKGKKTSKKKKMGSKSKNKKLSKRSHSKNSKKGKKHPKKRSVSKDSHGSRASSKFSFVRAKASTRLRDSEKFVIDELNWSTFDVIVSLQLVGAGIFLLLAFIAGIVGVDSFWSPMLMSLLLFVCSLPGFWCIVRNRIQDGIFAFSLTQISSGFCGLFWGSVTLLDFSQGDRREDWRSVAIMVIALWQFFTVIAVNSLPYRKVSLADVVKRLKKIKKQKHNDQHALDQSLTEEMPNLVSQNSQIVINMDDESRRSRRSQSSTRKRLESFLKYAKERKERDQMSRLQRAATVKQGVPQPSMPGQSGCEMNSSKEKSVNITMKSPSADSLSTANGVADSASAEIRVSPIALRSSQSTSTCPTQVSSSGLKTDATASSKSSDLNVPQKVVPSTMKPSVYHDSNLN